MLWRSRILLKTLTATRSPSRWVTVMILLLIAGSPLGSLATQSAISTGLYGNWLIGFDPATHLVSGYHANDVSSARDFACVFYFAGELSKSPARIQAFAPDRPEVIRGGILTTHLPGSITVGFDQGGPGCSATEMSTKWGDLHATRSYQWKEVRVVKHPGTLLFEIPDSKGVSHRTLRAGVAVGVTESVPGWLKVDYVTLQGGASGWAREDNFYRKP